MRWVTTTPPANLDPHAAVSAQTLDVATRSSNAWSTSTGAERRAVPGAALEPRLPDRLALRAAPGRHLPRRRAAHRRGRRLQLRARPRPRVGRQRLPARGRRGRDARPGHGRGHHPHAGPDPALQAGPRPGHLRALGRGPRHARPGAVRPPRDGCHRLAGCRHRAVRGRQLRAGRPSGPDPRPGLVGRPPLPRRGRPHRAGRRDEPGGGGRPRAARRGRLPRHRAGPAGPPRPARGGARCAGQTGRDVARPILRLRPGASRSCAPPRSRAATRSRTGGCARRSSARSTSRASRPR